ncbi:hypothetical protein [Mycolicibacterium brumae]|uniref:DUF2721 domain-containing protein n=1 Tax=Mycolicibacterium brumae TaxID=85968 RepID=A0A2G5P533_9MYCO|nr:hypothetical protein [Mycolicibacterium brumae]MCV7193436.1 hypothetical protein [Mycolicibacterium brumae]PIB73143.1 hypothetical protein CQY22_018095 [Mycolicibacterium brumae]RWA17138.1 hypothetical protein MBRU_05805 [Mycolicibacterium brumae DSM 44177]UWW09291.1 hypothetical protein L2Z93_002385 [Mycolicibacterium brumae]
MAAFADLAMGTAPILGGILLALFAGNVKGGPDVRAAIKADMDLLERLPPEQTERRAALQNSIDMRIDDLVAGVDRARDLRDFALSYQGNLRDVLMFLCTLAFAVVWWHVDHDRVRWLPLFVALILLAALSGFSAARALRRSWLDRHDHSRDD